MPDATDILKADAEGRYFDALGLDSDVAVEAVREREVVLCHRYRAQPDVVAAVHHAAEQAVDLLRTAISIPAVVDRLLLKWRPAWGVPSEDLSAFLRAQLNLERMVSDILGTIRQHGLVTEQEVLNICLMVLAGQEGQLKHEMAMWYVSRAAGIRNRAVADFNAASQGASLARAATLAGSLKTSLRAALACAERARMLEPGHQEVLGAVSKLHDDVAQADGVLASCRMHAAAQQEAWLSGCLGRLIVLVALVGGLGLVGSLCNRCQKRSAQTSGSLRLGRLEVPPSHSYGAPAVVPVKQAPAASDTYPVVPFPPSGVLRRFHTSEAIAPFEISTGLSGCNFYVKMVNLRTGKTAVTIFIRAGQSVTLDMPLGSYEMRYATGARWYGTRHLFGVNTQYNKADAVFDFTHYGSEVRGHRVELYLQPGGNLSTSTISAAQFGD